MTHDAKTTKSKRRALILGIAGSAACLPLVLGGPTAGAVRSSQPEPPIATNPVIEEMQYAGTLTPSQVELLDRKSAAYGHFDTARELSKATDEIGTVFEVSSSTHTCLVALHPSIVGTCVPTEDAEEHGIFLVRQEPESETASILAKAPTGADRLVGADVALDVVDGVAISPAVDVDAVAQGLRFQTAEGTHLGDPVSLHLDTN